MHACTRDSFKDDYETWRERWYDRRDDVLYWVGLTEHVCFAWNEPDTSFWNPVLDEEELGWRLIPDKYCLKNRVRNQHTPASIQHQPEAKGQLKPAPSVLFGTLEQHVIVANIDTGANLQLTDVAADMWNAIINNTDLDMAAAQLLTEYDVDEAMLKADLQDFAAAMQQQGILTS